MANIYTSSLSGMNAAQLAINTTNHNIANAQTPGFSRQVADLNSRAGQQTGNGFVGQGVDVSNVRRVYDQFLTTQVRQLQSETSQFETANRYSAQMDNLWSDATSGLSTSLQNFSSEFNKLSNAPESAPVRQQLMESAKTMASKMKMVDQSMGQIQTAIQQQMGNTVQNINQLTSQIGQLNDKIKMFSGSTSKPNDLLDQRDALVMQLSKNVNVQTIDQADGSVSVFVGTGQALVVGSDVLKLGVVPQETDPSQRSIVYMTQQGVTVKLKNESFNGGTLGGLMSAQQQNAASQRELGVIAMNVATQINQAQSQGITLNGTQGKDVFRWSASSVSALPTNQGTATATAIISDATQLTNESWSIKFSFGMYQLNRGTSAPVVLGPAPGTYTAQGVTFTFAGAPVEGDSFIYNPVANLPGTLNVVMGDGSEWAAAMPVMSTPNLANKGSASVNNLQIANSASPTLQNNVTITFDSATTWTAAGAVPPIVGSKPFVPGATILINGWSAQLEGAPQTGDTIAFGATVGFQGDNRNALKLAALGDQKILNGGTSSIIGESGRWSSTLGVNTQTNMAMLQASSTLLLSTQQQQQAVSGVNLDEEAANLLQQQKTYQASAKALQIANDMFTTILNLK